MAEKPAFDLGRRVRALDDWAVRLSAPPQPGGDGKEPFLFIDFQYTANAKSDNEKFRTIEFTVNLRKPGREGKIVFRPNLVQFGMICQAINDAADGKLPDGMIKLELLNTYINGQKMNKPELEFLAVVGVDETGVFIGISQPGRDNVKFYFTPPRMTQLRLRSGEVIQNGYASALAAKARVRIWYEHIDHLQRVAYMDDEQVEKAKADKKAASGRAFAQRQGGGGGGYSGNNGGGGYQQQQQSQPQQQQQQYSAPPSTGGTDDDIPW